MGGPTTRMFALLPLVSAALLWHAQPVTAQPAAPVQISWHTDYNTARKDAQDKGLPLIIVVGSDDCFYCRKLEAGPLKDPTLAAAISSGFVALKLDATRSPQLARALKVQFYPTTVLAAPDGKVHGFIEGYVEADRLSEKMKTTVAAIGAVDALTRDFNEASKLLARSEYPRAVALLKAIAKEASEKPIVAKAKQMLEDVERLARAQITRAKDLENQGRPEDALDALAETARLFAGTQAATEAATLLAGRSERPEVVQQRRERIARDSLATAREDFRAERLYDAMQKCEQLVLNYADLPEAKEANAILTNITSSPERLAKASDQMNVRTAAAYLALAESWLKKGHPNEAAACWRKVIVLSPNTRHADTAQAELTRLQGKGGVPAFPVGLPK